MQTVRSDDAHALSWSGENNRPIRDVRNLIRTWQGEAAFNRPMGLNPTWTGRVPAAALRAMKSEIRAQIAGYVPEANVLEVRLTLGALGQVVIEVDIDE